MKNETNPKTFRSLVKWAMTPPQAYVVYVIGLLLVYAVSYYAGTLNAKKPPPASTPPAATVPQR
jgi:hypothetical protein